MDPAASGTVRVIMRVEFPRFSAARRYLAPALLVAAATLQIVRAHTVEQSSWSGGGFGMFATYENEDSRFIRVWAARGDGEELVALPGDLSRQALEARVVPTRGRLRDLAEDVAARLGDDVTTVRAEVWGVRFEHPEARLRSFRIAHGTYAR